MRNIHPELASRIKSTEHSELELKSLPGGTVIKVKTRNSIYTIKTIARSNDVFIRGGKHIPKAKRLNFHGSTFGGSMIKVGYIFLGGHMEFNLDGKYLTTSAIESYQVEG